jgi:UDP-3-O-[3-hydroxymyristoyl] glucosamine N-acyltransferase
MDVALGELARELGGRVEGDPARRVSRVASLESADASAISFFANRSYKRAYLASAAGAVLVSEQDLELGRPRDAALVVVPIPYLAFARVAARFHRPPTYAAGVDPRAAIDAGAEIDPTATVMPFAYVGRGVKIGPRAVIHAGCALLDGAVIGEDSVLYPGVVVREGCTLGARTVVQPGAVIGGDGFGFAFDPENLRHEKIPQAGVVTVEDDVEIGANTCIDRGAVDATVVGRGSKLDNLVQVGHGATLGPLCLMAGQSAVGGSTHLGMGVALGGQAGVINHIDIGDAAKVAARSAVFSDLEGGGSYGGHPAIPQSDWLREQAALRALPRLLKELRELRRRVEKLESEEP